VERLNYYTRLIVDQEMEKSNDMIYIVSNISIYVFRLERQTITEVQTSSIAKIVEDLN